ncbi:MAG: DEAD/DEAH box helicase [Alphaproteobacteria bacterium]|nr:DEAD/DEAH box helicase [Alphaproteobacteria bacterium]
MPTEAGETSQTAPQDGATQAVTAAPEPAEALAADDTPVDTPSEDDAPVDASVDDAEPAQRGQDYRSGRLFEDFPISGELIKGLHEMGYTEATQVQAESIEPALAGKDMVVRAKTGTGKTAAFGVPIVERVEAGARYPQAIVLSPTRELAIQIAREISAIGKYKDIRVLTVYGGTAMGPQEKALEEGVEVIVGTPGRVLDHIRRKNLDLSRIRISCLDEADEMLSMGFYKEVTSILRRAPDDAQVLLFSATVEEDVKRIVRKYLKDPVDIMLSTDTDAVEGITHVLYEVDPSFHRARALLALIDQEEPGSTIIFCNTREDTATVATFLDRQGLDAQLISGELPQKKRERVMAMVKSGEVQFLVATDVAARGIDVNDLTHVINYTLPSDPAVYMHRVGRTGRIGKEGTAISLAGGADLATRLVLEKQFEVDFVHKELPTPEEAQRLRVDRMAARIKKAMASTAFEGFIGLARAIQERPDGDMLLATALRTFFMWDREQRARAADLDTVSAISEVRREGREGREGRDDQGSGRRQRRRRGKPSGRSRGSGRSRSSERRPSSERSAAPPPEARPPEASKGSGGDDARRKKRRRRRRRRSSGTNES